ncbi:MAG TPA: cell division protein FtsZ [Candidatus Magasanikbacteria bacterium]|nr:cell division protein FtsZ [Candidatus Magasanikbacteria bacterium]
MPEVKPAIETLAKIKVVGVGGSGGAAINRMMQSKIKGVEFIAINTDLQALHCLQAPVKIHIGKNLTRGLGAGMNPEVGYKAAEENQEEIREALKGADMVFITCGLGGGTGSGAGPLVADIAKSSGALTISVVTKPFSFEGKQRKEIGEKAHQDFLDRVDTIITIPNDRVMQIIDKKTPLVDAFKIIDDVLRQGVQGISEIITVPGLINVDFADVRAVMQDTGSALMGIGYGSGENRVVDAAKAAIASPLLDLSIDGAKGILFIVTAGSDVGMHEIAEAAKIVTGSADENAKVIWGTVIDDSLKDEVKITVIATGFDKKSDNSSLINRLGKSAFSSSFNTLTVPEPTSRVEKKNISSSAPSAPVEEEKSKMEFSRTEFSSTPLQKKPAKRVDLEPEDIAPVANKKEEEDMEIPAFLRRKMN